MPPVQRPLRAVLFFLTTVVVGERIITMGEAYGYDVVLPVALRVLGVSLVMWFLHVIIHEAGHWLMARAMDFDVREVRVGVLAFDLTRRRARLIRADGGGGVTSWPRGAVDLKRRVRAVALAGPLATLASTLVFAALYRLTGHGVLDSWPGIGLTMGAVVLFTAVLPGALLPRKGSDLDQWLFGPSIEALWLHASVLHALSSGTPVARVHGIEALERLAPLPPRPPRPLTLLWLLWQIESGRVAEAGDIIERVLPLLDGAPDWVKGDLAHVAGCYLALQRADLAGARRCLALVDEHQAEAWFSLLLEAVIARAGGEPGWAATLARWRAHVDGSEHRTLILTANRWVLERLEV